MDLPKETFSESFKYLFDNYAIYILLFTILFICFCFIYAHFFSSPHHLISEFKNFKPFRTNHYSESEPQIESIDRSKNSHFLVYGASGSGKTTFLKYYLNTLNLDYIVFARDDSTEWPIDTHFINFEQLNKIDFEKIKIKQLY